MNEKELDKWINGNKIKLNSKNLLCKSICYWKLIRYTVDRVKRQEDWMEKSLPIFDKFWKDVLYFREHPDELSPKKKKIILDI